MVYDLFSENQHQFEEENQDPGIDEKQMIHLENDDGKVSKSKYTFKQLVRIEDKAIFNLTLQDSFQVLFQQIPFQVGIFSIAKEFQTWNHNMAIYILILLVWLNQMIIFPTKWITWIKRW